MKKKSLLLAAVLAACTTSFAFATPQTTFEKGQTQLDLGAWNTKASTSASQYDFQKGGDDVTSDAKWNFTGGLTYGLSDKWAMQYVYHGLNTKANDEFYNDGSGNQNEVNFLYSLSKHVAAYAGWNRIHYSLDNSDADFTNNVAQLGVIFKAPLASNFDFYATGAIGTKKTSVWEAGLGYSFTKDFDINAGYRQVNTEANDDNNITFKGFVAGLSYRFGGSTPVETPAPEPVVETPAPAPQPVVHEYKDYYVDSIHFDFDVDTPMASEQTKLNNFVSVAKQNPNTTFKLVGNTDGKGGDSYNDDLSRRRVQNVANYAVNNGVSANQLQATYRGKNDPVSTNATDQGRADNRRVDIYMHK